MKVHKIRGIDTSVCCAEQMIAYNLAELCDAWKKQYQALPTAAAKADAWVKLRNYAMNHFGKLHGWKKWNRDAVFCALNRGLPAYLDNPRDVIYTTYRDIGDAFPLGYPAE